MKEQPKIINMVVLLWKNAMWFLFVANVKREKIIYSVLAKGKESLYQQPYVVFIEGCLHLEAAPSIRYAESNTLKSSCVMFVQDALHA